MLYNFNEVLSRPRTEKWASLNVINGCKVLPMSVADMDVVSPVEVREALLEVISRREFGYTLSRRDFAETICAWYRDYYGWECDPSCLLETPGLITTLGTLLKNLLSAEDETVLLTPVYHCFASVIKANDRRVLECPLLKDDNHYYTIDFEALYAACKKRTTRALVFCNPHNPVGRRWSDTEILRVIEICQETGTLLISDEIHGDFTFEDTVYTPVLKVAQDKKGILFLSSGGKIFNIGGFYGAFAITYDPEIRKALEYINHGFHFDTPSFAHEAAYAGYKYGRDYKRQLLPHIRRQQRRLCETLNALPGIVAPLPEATYLVWADFNGLGLDPEAIHEFLYRDAGVGFNKGSDFGTGGAGCARINCAVPDATLDECIKRLTEAYALRFKV